MGQQQLLLVILVTILVGIATVVAINTFGSSNVNANRDAVRNDLAAMAASAQAWYIKPVMLGGGGNDFTGAGADPATPVTFPRMGYRGTATGDGDTQFTNANGVYTLAVVDEDSFTITAEPSSNATLDDGVEFSFVATITAGGITIAEDNGDE